ncbi:peroxiredoxin [Candidatus Dependentiae bacterium]|nr:peroxiredoxin [Candidatus Dependentiae bacterium]
MLIGKKAPDFSCLAVVNGVIKDSSLQDYAGRMKVLVFYPLDFSFVCPTELHAFQDMLATFSEKNAVILGISVDSVYSHLAWCEKPKKMGGLEGVSFPLLSDITKTISRSYGVLDEEKGFAARGLFIIDTDDIIQHIEINNVSIGRNTAEVIRLLDAIAFVKKHGEACPINWTAGSDGLKQTEQGVIDYFSTKKS